MHLSKQFTLLVLLLLMTVATFAQQQRVTGTVSDASGNPVPGVTVRVQATNRGTVTDGQGRYSIEAVNGNTLIFSYTGYKSQNNVINGPTLNVTIQEDYANLDEVVITGLATSVKRSNLANAVATISAKQLYGVAPAQTFDAALSGKIPGALITANTGAPGGGISVKMRGVTSIFSNSQPLYVVDGIFISNISVPAGLNLITGAATAGNPQNQDNPSSRVADINPDDIENIEILKGASAAAIYGSKAAAGVILITTKKGTGIGRTIVRLRQDLGWGEARKLLGVRQFTEQTAFDKGGAAARDMFIAARNAGKLYDYEKEMYGEKGLISNTNASVNGGTERTGMYFSANRRSEEGIIKNSGYLNNAVRMNIDHQLSDRISLALRASYMNTSADRGLTNNDNNSVTYGVSLATVPQYLELHPDANGVYPVNPSAANPLETRDKMRNNETTNRFITGGEVRATLHTNDRTNTKLIVRGGVDFFNLKTEAIFPRTLQFMKGGLEGASIQGNTNNLNTNLAGVLVNSFAANNDLNFTTSLGATLETNSLDHILAIATNLIPDQSNVDQAASSQLQQFRQKYRDNGIFIQEEVLIMDAITLSAGVRFDRSTNNGDYKKYFVLPKASASWNLAKMPFWSIETVNSFKLRAAYGQAGNVAPYGAKFLALTSSNIGGQPGSLVDNQFGNPDIEQERQTELEAGLDVSFFNGRLTFEGTYYNKKIYDLLLRRNVASSSGFTQQWVNGGDLRNQGVEIGIGAIPVNTKRFRWNAQLNFWKNKSQITKLTIPAFPMGAFGNTLGNFFIEEGKSATQIIGTLGGGKGVGVLGNSEPDFQLSFYNDLTFLTNFSLRVMLHWKKGGDNINLTQYLSDIFQTTYDYDDDQNGNGIKDGVDRMAAAAATDASVRVQDASYVRIREIGLYYNIPIPKNNIISAVNVGISANNWFTWTDYDSYDPETSNFGSNTISTATSRGSNGISSGVEVTPYPAVKRAMFHLGVTF
ncbi:SusC/RagA family TonB-linked outer membrane protein [Chitinophaga barathri]|uniref:SusC/RagA family TonB-linked outer membrane protein n=1 Tax=Chitinophaga barathri TaxID=1647451 RepID=A0A3N4MFP6_9BACT|nr:SusC/RagA family TonB-linked outer membrane protein [Chitinophaga barathri]RPD42245.1 SusC/RagA family TonB-linked outer membrane protein [Chitinophaga barathri]